MSEIDRLEEIVRELQEIKQLLKGIKQDTSKI